MIMHYSPLLVNYGISFSHVRKVIYILEHKGALVREAAKNRSVFSGSATKRGGGKGLATKKELFLFFFYFVLIRK